jgi:nucleotide sugar dehydrogenase
MPIVYHGLGYVGLTGALHFAIHGNEEVLGYDPDVEVVNAINAGNPKAGEFLGYLGGEGANYRPNLRATADFDEVCQEPIHILAVPSERNGEPWMDLVKDVVRKLLLTLPASGLIIIESTLTPGTVDEIVNGFHGGRVSSGEVRLAVAPRRDWFADPTKNLKTLKRVIGGYDSASSLIAKLILSKVSDDIEVADYRVAELVKPLENALFHLPIMLAHEMAMIYPELDVVEAVRLAATHWRFASFGGLYLGLGSGGRCVPLGPRYLLAGAQSRRGFGDLLHATLEVDESMGPAVVDMIDRIEPEIATIAILGLAYRPGFADIGGSPALRLMQSISSRQVYLHDPVADAVEVKRVADATKRGWAWAELQELGTYDVVVLSTPHEVYLDLPEHVAWQPGQVVIDARGAWAKHTSLFLNAGVRYVQIGKPGWQSVPGLR